MLSWSSRNKIMDSVEGLSWREVSPNSIGTELPKIKAGLPMDSSEKVKVQEELVSTRKQIIGAAAVTWLNFIIGYSTGFVSPAIASMNAEESYFRVSENEISWIGSLMPLFALVGSSIGGFTLDKFGRRWTIILGGIPFVPSFGLTYLAEKVWLVMVGRALSGLAIGLSTVSVPVYLGELTGPKVRGFYGLLPTTSGNLGILVATLLGLVTDWRTMSFIGLVGILPFFFFTYSLVESPLWLAVKKRRQLDKIVVPVGAWKSPSSGCVWPLKSYCKREYMLPFFICLGMHIVQQFCGINAVITYATQIFQGVNSSVDPQLSTVIVSLVNVVSTLLATFLVDKIGRKMLMYVSLVMLLVSNLSLSAYYYSVTQSYGWTSEVGWLPLATLAVFILGFSLGAGPIPWLILGEVLPGRIRGTSASIVTAGHWVFTFVVTKTFVDVSEKHGAHVPFAGYAFICLMGLFLMEIVPETAGKTLEEIQNKMRKEDPQDVFAITLKDKKVPKVP